MENEGEWTRSVRRELTEYLSWKMREARLVIRDDEAFLKVVFEKEGEG